MKVIQLVSADFEDLELWCPVMRLREEGIQVDLVAEKPGKYYGKYGVPCEVELSFDDIDPADYDGVLVPGGWAPDKLRRFQKVKDIVSYMDKEHKLIGEICHAGWVLISAGILNGRKVTSTPGIKDDMENAGAEWLDEACVVDGNVISARRPPDIPEYSKALVAFLKKNA